MKSNKSHSTYNYNIKWNRRIMGKHKGCDFYSNNKRLTLQRKTAAFLGISFYDTFVKPLLKLRQRYKYSINTQFTEFITKAKYKTMITQIKAKPNLRKEILEQINKELNGSEERKEEMQKMKVNE